MKTETKIFNLHLITAQFQNEFRCDGDGHFNLNGPQFVVGKLRSF